MLHIFNKKGMYPQVLLGAIFSLFMRFKFARHETGLNPTKIFSLIVPRRCFFCGSFMLFLSCFVLLLCASVY